MRELFSKTISTSKPIPAVWKHSQNNWLPAGKIGRDLATLHEEGWTMNSKPSNQGNGNVNRRRIGRAGYRYNLRGKQVSAG
jgi:hypothetical protein